MKNNICAYINRIDRRAGVSNLYRNWRMKVSSYYRNKEYKVTSEFPIGNGKTADLVIEKDNLKTAVEIETGKSNNTTTSPMSQSLLIY